MKYDMICIEGIDKTCKDLVGYIMCKLCNYKYIFIGRGLISMMAYSKLYNRPYAFNPENAKNIIFINLNTEKLDWIARCEKSDEKPINFEENVKAFRDAIDELKEKLGDDFKLIEFNVSHQSLHDIALEALKYVEKLNNEAV